MPRDEQAIAERLASMKAELAPDLEVIRLLGKGRMAEVYLARQVSLDRLVAVKVLSRPTSRDPSAQARFDREAKAAAALQTPHAVSVYRFGHLEDGTPYLVMEYVSGGTLEDKLEAEGPLPEADVREILGNTAEALSAAHDLHFVHRDVRAANVLCDRSSGRALLTDFGLAGIKQENQDADARITRTGEIIGTPGYLSPEQLKGEPATEATDVFALGLMGYELLTGQGPFTGATQRETIMRSLREPPTPLQDLRPGIDPGLAKLLERCLGKEPEKRPSAAFVAKALRGGGEGRADGAGPIDTATDLTAVESLLKRRLPQTVVATFVVGIALLYFVGMLADVWDQPIFQAGLATFVGSLIASGIIAWFHGEKGPQR
ncbi:MAG: serine/threonine protein kinase, partial [Gemmatimonadetes bacterium]|nr:serine/threonine protein kinase [Gemmatimonadota bacterium]